jgi:hypothetical protein
VLMAALGISLGRTLAMPGDAGSGERVAGWARDHQLGFVVDQVDRVR